MALIAHIRRAKPLTQDPEVLRKIKRYEEGYGEVARQFDESCDDRYEEWDEEYDRLMQRSRRRQQGGVIATVRRLARSSGGLKGPFKDKHDETFYRMDLSKDRFIHFTTPELAKAILKSKKLLLNPPGVEGFGARGVFGVSVTWGWYVPGVQTTHIKSPHLVAILFTTTAMPRPGNFVEEVVWEKDVPLKTAKLISKGEAIRLLKKSPFKLKDEETYVVYR